MGFLESYRETVGKYAPAVAGAGAVLGISYAGVQMPLQLVIVSGAAAGYVVSLEPDSTKGALHGGAAALALTLL